MVVVENRRNVGLTAYEEALPADPGDLKAKLPFNFSPAIVHSPLVISFPHVGLRWPTSLLRPAPQVHFGRNADFEVHRLFPNASERSATLQAIYSRLLVDLNRAADDVNPELVPDHPAPRPRPGTGAPGTLGRVPNRGILWDTAVGNIPILSAPVTFAELKLRLDRYYFPYYRALEILLARRRERFGYAILLEAHSMPSSVPGDIILGTLEGGSCSPDLEARALDALRTPDPVTGRSLDIRLNNPYRGGNLVRSFGRPEQGIHALQVEVSRSLYMDESTFQVWAPSLSAVGSAAAKRSHARLLTHRRRRLDLLLARLDHLLLSFTQAMLDPQVGVTKTPLSSPRLNPAAPHQASSSSSSVPPRGDSPVQPDAPGQTSRQITLGPSKPKEPCQ